MAKHGEVRIGVSGWRYPPWRGVFYPKGLVQRNELAYASRRFATLEINGSFYSLQTPRSWQAWHDAVPGRFAFCVKAPKYITHQLRLVGAQTPIANFFASGLALLGRKLGALLWQLPPSLHYDRATLEAFLALLPRSAQAATALAHRHDAKVAGRAVLDYVATCGTHHALRHALEVRHASFATSELFALLRAHDVALVIADTGGRWPEVKELTAGFAYLRLHGASKLYESGYSDAQLAKWAALIRSFATKGRDVFCYFDNTMKESAPQNAAHLAQLLDVQWPPPGDAFQP
jgi:uncharacterized protein YecE (DUF72 family)